MSLKNIEEEFLPGANELCSSGDIVPGAVVTTEEPLAKKVEEFEDYADLLEEDTVTKVLRNYRKNKPKREIQEKKMEKKAQKMKEKKWDIKWSKEECKHGPECLDSFDVKKTFDKLTPILIKESKSSTWSTYKIHECDLVWCYSDLSKDLPKKSYQDLKHSYEKYERLVSYAKDQGFVLRFRWSTITNSAEKMYGCNGSYNYWTSHSHTLSDCQPIIVSIIDINQEIPEIAAAVDDPKKPIFQRFLNFFKKLMSLKKCTKTEYNEIKNLRSWRMH
jgi:hypothetical protein